MALTPEDVLNKTFTQTQFRRGYDEREVDDFLDEVVAEMRRMVKDSEDLRARAEDGGSAATAVSTAPTAGADAGTPDEALARENKDLKSRLDELSARVEKETAARDERAKGDAASQQGSQERVAGVTARADEAEKKAQQRIEAANAAAERAEAEAKQRQERAAKEQAAKPQPAAASTDDGGAGEMAAAAGGGASASGLIALAQRLHDEHVAEGRTQREKLVAEARHQHDELISTAQGKHDELMSTGQSKHDEFIKTGQGKRDQFIGEGTSQRDKMISDAQVKSSALVTEAEEKRKKILDDLNAQKTSIESRIAELTAYERDYRRKLKEFMSEQLKGLESSASVAPQPSAKN